MATRGFEFAYMLDGATRRQLSATFTLGRRLRKVGDLMLMQSDGYIDQVTGTTTEGNLRYAEPVAAAAITARTTKAKAAIITNLQVWRCSMDATVTTALPFMTKPSDTADCNTIDADDLSNGRMMLVAAGTDDDGNVLAYVTFRVPSAGNALS